MSLGKWPRGFQRSCQVPYEAVLAIMVIGRSNSSMQPLEELPACCWLDERQTIDTREISPTIITPAVGLTRPVGVGSGTRGGAGGTACGMPGGGKRCEGCRANHAAGSVDKPGRLHETIHGG